MATCDFVLLHNKAAEGVAKHDRVGYDIFSGIADTTALFLEYCKQFDSIEKRCMCRSIIMVLTHCVVPAGNGEDPTSISIPGFLVDAKQKAKRYSPLRKLKCSSSGLTENLNHKNHLYLELHHYFSKVENVLQSEASLKNCKTSRHRSLWK